MKRPLTDEERAFITNTGVAILDMLNDKTDRVVGIILAGVIAELMSEMDEAWAAEFWGNVQRIVRDTEPLSRQWKAMKEARH